jgi:hypothetical protein
MTSRSSGDGPGAGPRTEIGGSGRAPVAGEVLLLGVGDTHGDFAPLFEVARREPGAAAILQVGDLTAGKAGRESRPDDDPATLAGLRLPLVWVHGNHEHWEAVSQIGRHLWPGDEYVVPGTDVRVVGLPGNYAPTWYQLKKPFPGDRVRHFNADDVAAVEAATRLTPPAVLLMHETIRGHSPGRIGAMGIPLLAQLVRRVRPSVCLTGHHHTYAAAERGHTLAIALPRAQRGYVRLRFAPSGRRVGWEYVPLDEPAPAEPDTVGGRLGTTSTTASDE